MKIIYKTKDYFNFGNIEERALSETICRNIANELGISTYTKYVDYRIDGNVPILYLEGTKKQFFKYYLKTHKYTRKNFKCKFNHLKRILEVIFW